MNCGDTDRKKICQEACLRGKVVSVMVEVVSSPREDEGVEYG